ncbi:MAG: hypothetical protein IJA86_06625 [Clostridia bacterium]|nr:hypothetical protein [Clostridia bacterium]
MKDNELSGKMRLKEALKLSDQTYVDKHPKTENEIRYSEKYLYDIERLKKGKKFPYSKYFNIAGKRLAGIAAAILIVAGCSITAPMLKESVTEFFETISSVISENPFFKNPDIQSTQELDPLTRPQESESAVEPHEHDFTVLNGTDANKHYYSCSKSGCKEEYSEHHKYIYKPGTSYLECEVCGRRPK